MHGFWLADDIFHVLMQDKLAVDVGLWSGLVPSNAGDRQQLQGMWDMGVLGFKSFMPPSGLLPRSSSASCCTQSQT